MSASLRMLVCGGRDFDSDALMSRTLTAIWREADWCDLVVIHGGARGADHLAHVWAHAHMLPVVVFPADWERYGKGAGPIRNQQMLDEGKPDLVVAFPGGRGTADMCRRARAAGVEVRYVGKDKQMTGGITDHECRICGEPATQVTVWADKWDPSPKEAYECDRHARSTMSASLRH